ncbi:MAG TPA: ribosomal protein S18-alanine N-acetyltransferase [Mycobacteriales bacterium]|nr:ribosomal protein S18-alanine N-acetyltransferase [Mycobacteriales bacterium]
MTAASIERLRWWDLPHVRALEAACFAPDDWSVETFWSELAQGATRHYVVARQGADIVGYAGLASSHDEAYVQTIAVAESHRGRRLGAALLRDLLAEAVRRRSATVDLEVRANDPVAQGLYAKAGFIPIGRRRRYYAATGEDALVMRCGDPAAGAAALSS